MNRYTLYSIIVFPVLSILVVTFSTISFSKSSLKEVETLYSTSFSSNYIKFSKEIIYNTVRNFEQAIAYEIENIEYQLKHDLKDKLEIASRIIETIYKNNREELSIKEMQNIVIERLEQLKFNNSEGYYFIFDSKTNHIIGHPIKKLIGVDFTHNTDVTGKPTLGTFILGLKSKKFTFDKMYFYKPNDSSLTQYPKINSTFEFKPLNLIIGTGEYFDTIEHDLKEKYLRRIDLIKGTKNINIYTKLNEKTFINVIDESRVKEELSDILNRIILEKENFYTYTVNEKTKQSYFYYLKRWNWVIESSFYLDESKDELKNIKKEIDARINKSKNESKLIIFLSCFITLIVSIIFLNKIRNIINNYTQKLNKYINIIDQNVITTVANINNKIIDVSNAFCNISGYTKDEVINNQFSKEKYIDIPSELQESVWKCIRNKKNWEGELQNIKKDGSFYWVNIIISPNIDEYDNVIGYTSIQEDITDKKRVEELSITDGLTNLYNRRHFDEVFSKSLSSSRREKDYFCLILMDIDHFKQYNDTYGHQKGDEVLRKLSSCLQNNMRRANDLAFRLGGEEFGVLFKTDEKEKAYIHANNLKNEIEKLEIIHEKNSASKYVTISMGLICDIAKNLPAFDKVYREADKLLYKAKETGRNKVVHNKLDNYF